jgi:hypothetical protein
MHKTHSDWFLSSIIGLFFGIVVIVVVIAVG